VKRRKATLLDDARYDGFVERYAPDPLRFAVEVCGLIPSDDQVALLNGLIDPTAKISVASGTGTGKTFSFARIALWHLLCHPVALYDGKVEIGSNTYIGAPRVAQVADGIWKEMQDATLAMRNGPLPWLADYFTITKTRVVVNGFEDQWFVAQLAMQQGKSVGVAGKHRFWQLIIVDEAAGVPDTHFDVIDGTQTQGGNRTLMASQGVRNSGRFYDSHHSLSVDNGGSWLSLTFSSEDSPFVTARWLRERVIETGGRDTTEYQIRVLGRFAENYDKYLLGRSVIEKRIDTGPVIAPGLEYGHMLIVDVAAGVFRDKTVCTHVHVWGSGDRMDAEPRHVDVIDIPVFSNALDWGPVARMVKDYADRLSNVTIVVDVGGQGVQFAKRLEELGCTNVVGINWGMLCFKRRNKERFVNLRAQCSVHAAEAVKDGRISFTDQYKKELLDQGSRIPFTFDDRARWKIESKENMAAEGIPSPDLWDTVCMAFLEGVHYLPADGITIADASASSLDEVRKAAQDAFADA
jgi:hypothetical protein